MKREGPSGVAGTHQGRDDEHPQDGHGLLPARLARLLRPLARFECTLASLPLQLCVQGSTHVRIPPASDPSISNARREGSRRRPVLNP